MGVRMEWISATQVVAQQTTCAPFWGTFWPDLVATLVGVGLGLPIGLYINSRLIKSTRGAEERARKDALARAAAALRWSITWNGEKAELLVRDIRQGDVPIMTPLETERWEATKAEFVRVAHDPELQARVAYFFDQVRRAGVTADRWFEFKFGMSSSTVTAAEVDRALHGQLLEDLPGIAQEARELDRILSELSR